MKPLLINRMQFYTTSKCQLRCNFCPLSTDLEIPSVYMDMDQFTKYADLCLDAGITEYELSPIVGDPLLDRHLAERVKYLNDDPRTTLVFIFTNLLSLSTRFMDSVLYCEKFEFKLSIYGDTKEKYLERTGRDLFDKYCSKLDLLANYLRIVDCQFTLSEIVIRFLGYKSSDIKDLMPTNLLYRLLYGLVLFKSIPEYAIVGAGFDVNWVDDLIYVEETIQDDIPEPHKHGRTGVCEYAIVDNGIWPNGDIGICSCWFDINKKMILGNVNETSLQELYGEGSFFEQIIEEQGNNLYRSLCKSCTWSCSEGQT
jgi:MoaA/NifB/PqqE/SkfB family radical SAM enzyme